MFTKPLSPKIQFHSLGIYCVIPLPQTAVEEKGDQSGLGKMQEPDQQVQQSAVLGRRGPDLRQRRSDLQEPMSSGPGHLSVRIYKTVLKFITTLYTDGPKNVPELMLYSRELSMFSQINCGHLHNV